MNSRIPEEEDVSLENGPNLYEAVTDSFVLRLAWAA